MICAYCKAEIPSNSRVCPKCKGVLSVGENEATEDIFSSSGGSFVPPKRNESSEIRLEDIEKHDIKVPELEPIKPKKKKSRALPVMVAVVVLVAVLFGVFSVITGPSSQVKKLLKSGQYDEALGKFNNSFSGRGGFFIERALSERILDTYEEYSNGEREYKSAQKELDTISKMGVEVLDTLVSDTKEKAEKLNKSQIAFDNAEKYFGSKNFALAIKEYKKVIKADSNYETAKKKLTQAENNYRNNCVSTAAKLAQGSDFEGAIKTLSEALEILQKDKLIEKRIKEYTKYSQEKSEDTLIENASAAAEKGDYASAISTLMYLEENAEISNQTKVSKNLEYYREKYEEDFKSTLGEYISSSDYVGAINLLTEAQTLLPDSKAVETERKKIEHKLPVFLDDLSPDSSTGWKFGGAATDSFGVDRGNEVNYIRLAVNSSAVYNIDGDYKELRLSAAAAKDIDPTAECKVKISAQKAGETFYREIEISAAKEAEDVKMVIEHCNSLSFEVIGEGADALLYNIMLVK